MTELPTVKPKLLLLDVDGVMTDGRKTYDLKANVVSKVYCDLDFTAIKCFKACDVPVVLISGDQNVNRDMAKSRGIDFIFTRRDNQMIDKADYLQELLQNYRCTAAETIFCGDDIFDLKLLQNVGWSFCPFNSPGPVKDGARYTLKGCSGEYLVMEIFEYLVARGLLTFPTAQQVSDVENRSETVRYD